VHDYFVTWCARLPRQETNDFSDHCTASDTTIAAKRTFRRPVQAEQS